MARNGAPDFKEAFSFTLPKLFIRRMQQEAKLLGELARLKKENKKPARVLIAIRKRLDAMAGEIAAIQTLIIDALPAEAGVDGAAAIERGLIKKYPLHWTKQPGVDPEKIRQWQIRRLTTQGRNIGTTGKGRYVTTSDGKLLSAASRKAMGAATKARWQKYRKNKKNGIEPLKPRGSFAEEKPKAKYSAEGRAKMAEAGRRTAALLKERAAKRKAEAAAAAKAAQHNNKEANAS